jgi:hypothetical protein
MFSCIHEDAQTKLTSSEPSGYLETHGAGDTWLKSYNSPNTLRRFSQPGGLWAY